MAKGKHILYSHDLQMLKNLLMQCPTFKVHTYSDGKIHLHVSDYKALWELKVLVEEILEQVEDK